MKIQIKLTTEELYEETQTLICRLEDILEDIEDIDNRTDIQNLIDMYYDQLSDLEPKLQKEFDSESRNMNREYENSQGVY